MYYNFWLDFIIVQIFHNVLQSWSGWTVSIYILMMEFLTSSPTNQPTHPPTNEPGSRDAIASKNKENPRKSMFLISTQDF